MTRREHIERVLEDFDSGDLLSIVGSAHSWDGSLEDQNWMPLDMDEIWSCYVGSASNFEDFVRAAACNEFDPNDDYWQWTWNGIASCNEPDFDLDEIADWIEEQDEGVLYDALGTYYARQFAFDEAPDEPEEEDDPFGDGRMTEAEIAEAVSVYARNQSDEQKAELIRKASEAERRMLDPIDVLQFIAEEFPCALD